MGVVLGARYHHHYSDATISRFETLKLSYIDMCKLKPKLEKWLQEAELAASINKGIKRKGTAEEDDFLGEAELIAAKGGFKIAPDAVKDDLCILNLQVLVAWLRSRCGGEQVSGQFGGGGFGGGVGVGQGGRHRKLT